MTRPVWPSELHPFRNRLMGLLYDEGLTLQELGDLFGLTRERVRQVSGREHRPRGGSKSTARLWSYRTVWMKLTEWGVMSLPEAAVACGLSRASVDVLLRRFGATGLQTRPTAFQVGFRTVAGAEAWIACRRAIMASAWMDGATTYELADLFGMKPNQVAPEMARMRRAGWALPYRHPSRA